jgi:3-oxoacyl-[acyl-carrier protein] reductase
MPTHPLRLSAEAAIVTGAGSGIGAAVARALGAAGVSVMAVDINPDHADDTADAITSAGGKAIPWQADVSNRFQVGSMIESARDAFGRVGILVNAAGVVKRGAFSTLDEWDWRRVLDVNLTGTFFCCQLMGRVMAEEGGGAILNLASTVGISATLPDGVSYAASKAGIIGLTRQAARELASRGVRVNALALAGIDGEPPELAVTAPLSEVAALDDAAQTALFLCSDAARIITGQVIVVDGGISLLP